MKRITFFISGHRNITQEEFDNNYIPAIQKALEYKNVYFVVGDYYGTDIMAQNYLVDVLGVDPRRITVYHMFTSPRNINPKIQNTKGGFTSDSGRDEQMTKDSDYDIAFVRDPKKISGTAENILRRNKLK
jgi:hypothetical protein